MKALGNDYNGVMNQEKGNAGRLQRVLQGKKMTRLPCPALPCPALRFKRRVSSWNLQVLPLVRFLQDGTIRHDTPEFVNHHEPFSLDSLKGEVRTGKKQSDGVGLRHLHSILAMAGPVFSRLILVPSRLT